ncbi:MAG: hypothetical protein ACFE9M_05275 [Promethearchaeota archaeon]
MVKINKKKVFLKLIVFITLISTFYPILFYNNVGNQNEKVSNESNIEGLLFAQESIAPIITFIQPTMNNTVILDTSYKIIVNITDEHPPLFGNVTFQISNVTTFLFNATMEYEGVDAPGVESSWSFNWDNLTLYPNNFYKRYIIRIWAIDSSTEGNIGKSEDFYIYLNLPTESPGLINVIFYLFAAVLIIAGLVVYLNKKLLPKSIDEGKERIRESY